MILGMSTEIFIIITLLVLTFANTLLILVVHTVLFVYLVKMFRATENLLTYLAKR